MTKRIGLIAFGVLLFVGLIMGGYFGYKYFAGQGTLTIWTVQGNEEAVKLVGDIYRQKHPLARIKIVPISQQAIEFKTLYALASQQGPDIWIMPNEWMELHRSKLVAAPNNSLDIGINSYQRKRNKEEPKPTWPAKGRTNQQVITQDYGPIVANDVIANNQVWGVPLNMDSLALFYDKTKINPAPSTWRDVVELTKKFTIRDGSGKVTRSAVALGDTQAVAHSIDVLSALMLQNGTDMVDEQGNLATFNISQTGATPPGTNAVDFYTSFTEPNRETYTWDSSFGPSLAALKQGKTMMAFGYLSDLPSFGTIGTSTIGVAPLPQTNPDDPKTYGQYLVAGVTKQAKKPTAAWEFVSLFANPDASEAYASSLRAVPARIDVAKRMKLGPQYVPFQEQVAYVTNWPKREASIANGALAGAINAILTEHQKPQVALDVASKAYTEFLQAPTGIETDPLVLSFWQSDADRTDYKSAINSFVTGSKDIKRIAISKHPANRYEWEALNAMAAGLGPDIFLAPNDMMPHFAPMLRQFRNGFFNQSAGRLNDVLAYERTFAPAAKTDNVINNGIYGAPASLETLMIIYNADLFNKLEAEHQNDTEASEYRRKQSLFIQGPLLWDDLKTMAKIATKRNGATLTQPFIALGTGSNAANSQDVFAAIMRQYGGEMTDPDRLVTGLNLPIGGKIPGKEAEDLIKSFANPANDWYTWNAQQEDSITAFGEGKVMAVLAYSSDMKRVRELNPRVNLSSFALPQVAITQESAIDYASYYTLTVPKAGKLPAIGGKFIKTVITNGSGALQSAVQSSSSVKIQDRNNSVESPQAMQVNTATSYYKGLFPNDVDQALVELLDNKINLEQSANKINLSLKQKIL